MANSNWHFLVKLAQNISCDIDAFVLTWDEQPNKELYVQSVTKYAQLKTTNRPLYNKIKRWLAVSDESLSDLMFHLMQKHSSQNGKSQMTNDKNLGLLPWLILCLNAISL